MIQVQGMIPQGAGTNERDPTWLAPSGLGIKKALAVHRQTAKLNGDGLLNIMEGRDPSDERQPVPLMLFPTIVRKPPKRFGQPEITRVVENERELVEALEEGWRRDPYQTQVQEPENPALENKKLREENAQLNVAVVQQSEKLEQLTRLVEELLAAQSQPKPKHGKG